jgi:hypothetical protein
MLQLQGYDKEGIKTIDLMLGYQPAVAVLGPRIVLLEKHHHHLKK